MTLREGLERLKQLPDSEVMPTLFVGHGSPMNAIEINAYSEAWRKLGATLPRPHAIVMVSAHWLTEGGTLVQASEHPKTIHDFWGFPKELYDISYAAPGSPTYADAARDAVSRTQIQLDTAWGLDHGTWSVLRHMYPNADVPVVQVSIDFSEHGDFHFELGRELQQLRSKGVLIMGSGNIVHNLGLVQFSESAKPYDWAIEFDAQAKALLDTRDFAALTNYQTLGSAASHAIPTPDHYWPLLYVLGAARSTDTLSYPVEGIAHSSVSMRAVLLT